MLCTPQPHCSLQLPSHSGYPCQSRQPSGDVLPISLFPGQSYALAEERQRSRIIASGKRYISQRAERRGNYGSSNSQFAEHRYTLLTKQACPPIVALIVRHPSKTAHGDRTTVSIAKLPEQRQTLLEERSGPLVVALEMGYSSQVPQRSCRHVLVLQISRQRQTLLEERSGPLVVALETCYIPQAQKWKCDTALVLQFSRQRQTLLEERFGPLVVTLGPYHLSHIVK